MTTRVDLVAGARPNFVKLAPVARALSEHTALRARIIHTGQHYDAALSGVFFAELGIAEPEVSLDVGSGTHGEQTARILERYEAHLLRSRPRCCVVFGDVNSTIACALAASKLHVPVVHVEAGLRSFDRTMPEEINRILTDAIADLLLVTEPAGVANLRHEGVSDDRIALVGNPMIDTLRHFLDLARARRRAGQLGLARDGYGVVTLHRPSNVDDAPTLRRLVGALREVAERQPLVFPVHPRTRQAAGAAGVPLEDGVRGGLLVLPPEPYLDHLSLMSGAAVVLTDSGGMQEECAVLGVPCVTLRERTERPVTVEVGASRLVGSDPDRIREAHADAIEGRWPEIGSISLWDGHAGHRIAEALESWLSGVVDA